MISDRKDLLILTLLFQSLSWWYSWLTRKFLTSSPKLTSRRTSSPGTCHIRVRFCLHHVTRPDSPPCQRRGGDSRLGGDNVDSLWGNSPTLSTSLPLNAILPVAGTPSSPAWFLGTTMETPRWMFSSPQRSRTPRWPMCSSSGATTRH